MSDIEGAAIEPLHEAITAAVRGSGIAAPGAASTIMASAVIDQIHSDPVAMNALGQEPWYRSGVMWGGAGGVFTSLSIVFHQLSVYGTPDFSWDASMGAGGTLFAAAYTLYRRFYPGLKPMFHHLVSPVKR